MNDERLYAGGITVIPIDRWCQDFNDGGQYDGHRNDNGRARAVRRLIIK